YRLSKPFGLPSFPCKANCSLLQFEPQSEKIYSKKEMIFSSSIHDLIAESKQRPSEKGRRGTKALHILWKPTAVFSGIHSFTPFSSATVLSAPRRP
uniref:hypothetical protein n=1 Tax=Candidatus Fimivicinus sp. TaxID=3056640 RepID=UPI003FF0DDCE